MKRNFRLAGLLLAIVMIMGLALSGCGVKDTDPVNAAYVTLTIKTQLVKASDGSFIAAKPLEIPAEGSTVADVLKAIHTSWFSEGESGYAVTAGQYGDMISKFWGIETNGGYSYYVNGSNNVALTELVKPGDYVDFVIIKDGDSYMKLAAQTNGSDVLVAVQAVAEFDADEKPVFAPLAGTKVCYIGATGNLVDTGVVTGEDGTASISLKDGIYRIIGLNTDGNYTVSAQKVTVTKK